MTQTYKLLPYALSLSLALIGLSTLPTDSQAARSYADHDRTERTYKGRKAHKTARHARAHHDLKKDVREHRRKSHRAAVPMRAMRGAHHVERRVPVYGRRVTRTHHRVVAPRRHRHYHGTRVIRRHGPVYRGYGFHFSDRNAFKWLAFTAITVKLLDNLNEQQQRQHEAAQVEAASAKVNETIHWEDGNASGAVTTTRIGTSTSGRQCREFQQTITVGGRSERAYGTACLQPDGAWEIVRT